MFLVPCDNDSHSIFLLQISPDPMSKKTTLLASLLATVLMHSPVVHVAEVAAGKIDSIEALGQRLYFDTNLSRNRTQSCATCHAPSHGFVDNRGNGVEGAVSLGDDGKSLGDRNAPTASYASFSPDFHQNKDGKYIGGQFLDGREKNLEGQAGGPPLNPIEMGMPDKASVVQRIQENADYAAAFKRFYGDSIFADPEDAYGAMTRSIAAFEKTDYFSPFDSKYDRYLRGEYTMTTEEDLGMTLFFSQQFSNCNICHQLKKRPAAKNETFSNYEYHNIGTPVNMAVRQQNGLGSGHIDHGLLDNPAINDTSQDGKFKVPTLRNVAITGPYMHNGVFRDLRTVVLFYNKYNSRSEKRQINPETGVLWAAPEVDGTLSMDELQTGPAFKDREIDALVAFMQTLTDARFEYLLETQSGK
jgi:cytochrome c peroxidase